jgi:hypothetical protein
MAERVQARAITVPAGTLSTSPADFDLPWPRGDLVRLQVRIPPGPSGLVGFAVGHSNQTIIPADDGEWIIGEDEPLSWDTSGYPTGDAWFVRAYNEDIYPHTLYFRAEFNEVRPSNMDTVAPLAIEQPDQEAVSVE